MQSVMFGGRGWRWPPPGGGVWRSMSVLVQGAATQGSDVVADSAKMVSIGSMGKLTHATAAKVKFLGVFVGLVDDSKRKRQYGKALEKRRRVVHRLRQLQKQRQESWAKEVERLAFNAFTRGYRKTLNTIRSGSKAKQAIFDKATELGLKSALSLTDQHPLMTTDDLKRLLEQEEDHFGRLGWEYLPVSVKTAYENLIVSIDDACDELKAEIIASGRKSQQQIDPKPPRDDPEPCEVCEDSGPDVCYADVMERVTDPEALHAAYERIKPKLQLLSGKSDEEWNDLTMSSFDHMAEKLRTKSYYFSPVTQIHVRRPGLSNGESRAIVVVNPRDQIVGEAVRAEVERIYTPAATAKSSSHMALEMIKKSWKGTTWFLHYNSPIVFGKVQHENLVRILAMRIQNEEFLHLVREMFRSSIVSLGDRGSRLSALLCNIYYHELDMEVARMQSELNSGSIKRTNVAHVSQYPRVRYVRYGEEFLFGITGSKAMAVDVWDRVQEFLRRELKQPGS